MTLIICDLWIMTMSCSQVCGDAGHYYHHTNAPTLRSTPVAVYVLLECVRSVCIADALFHALPQRTSSAP